LHIERQRAIRRADPPGQGSTLPAGARTPPREGREVPDTSRPDCVEHFDLAVLAVAFGGAAQARGTPSPIPADALGLYVTARRAPTGYQLIMLPASAAPTKTAGDDGSFRRRESERFVSLPSAADR
jgi:hypothetical protein